MPRSCHVGFAGRSKRIFVVKTIFPSKLQPGDEIRVIAPSRSMGIISNTNKTLAINALENIGLYVTFGQHVDEHDQMHSSSTTSRISDLHKTFATQNENGRASVRERVCQYV